MKSRVWRRYLRRAWKNKVLALTTLVAGLFSVWIFEDAAGLVFYSMFAIPLFFAKENWVM